jgi:Fe-S-cluster containining protein
MTAQKHVSIPADIGHKKELLEAIYTVYSRWVERFPLACRKGCAACCTQSVTMTSLEGEVILDFVMKKRGKKWLREKFAQTTLGKSTARITTNQFAGACLNQREIDGDTLGGWDFTPCVFIDENLCSIYEVRPFGCRSFGSLVRCAADRAAEMAQVHLAVNTVFTQIIEHINSDGGYWATMNDILHNLADCGTGRRINILPARPLPGFLLEDQEVQVVHVLLQQLRGQFSGKGIIGDLIDNFMPI